MGEREGGDLPPKKTQSDAVAAAADVPTKKLARQLDFTGYVEASGSVVLPEHPQSQPASRAQPVTEPPLQSAMQSQPQPPVVAMPVATQTSCIPSARMV